jgi:hypothetical protein
MAKKAKKKKVTAKKKGAKKKAAPKKTKMMMAAAAAGHPRSPIYIETPNGLERCDWNDATNEYNCVAQNAGAAAPAGATMVRMAKR